MTEAPHRRRPPGLPALLAVLALLATAPPAGARDWYVRKTGADLLAIDLGLLGLQTNLLLLGTNLLPFRTLSHTALFVGPGDRVFVGPGTYTENVSLSGMNYASSPLLWRAETPGTVTIRATSAGRTPLIVSGSSGHAFRGLRFRPHAAGTDDDAAAWLSDCDAVQFENCVFDGGRYGIVLHQTTADLADCTYSGSGDGAYCFAGSDLTATGCDVALTNDERSGFFASDSRLTLTDCHVTGGQHGVRYDSGPGATVTDCTSTDAVYGLVMQGDNVIVAGCDLVRCTVGVYLSGGPGVEPAVRDSAIRDGVVGLYALRSDLTLEQVAITGCTDAAVRVAASVASFALDALKTVDAADNGCGLAWDGDASTPQSLAVDLKNWANNQVHIKTDHIETVDVRNATLSQGETALEVENGAAVIVRDSRFLDNGAAANLGAGADLQAASVAVSGCTFERGHVGLRIRGASDPDLKSNRFEDCGGAGLDLRDSSWSWTAADALTFDGNLIGVHADSSNWTVDGGVSGVSIAGPGAVAGSRGLIDVGGTATWRRVTVADAASGFEALGPLAVTLENCGASGCSEYGLYIERDPGQTVPRPVTATHFTATDCGTGVGYRRGADAAADVGEIELYNVTISRAATVDADGYVVGATGTGIYLDRCPLDPALHSNLTISGCEHGVDVRDAAVTVTAATNLQVERCGTAVFASNGAASFTDWTSATNHRAVAVSAGTNPATLSNCQFTSRDEAATVHSSGPFSASVCSFASLTADALLFAGAAGAAFDATLIDCTVGQAGIDGFHVTADPAFGGAVTFQGCRVLAAEGDGMAVSACTAASFVDCEVTDCRNNGFTLLDSDAAFRDCSAAAVGRTGFEVTDGGAVTLEDCTVEGFGTATVGDGFSLVRCANVALNRCATASGPGDGLRIHDGGTGPFPDGAFRVSVANLLARNVLRGVRTGGACAATLMHLTVDAADVGLNVAGGEATAINCVFVGGAYGVRRDAGTLTLDHVLLHGATPAGGVAPGPNDLLAPPYFRDAAGGDYRLAKGSPAINAGKDLGGAVNDDLAGAVRPSFRRCELGCYEYLEAAGGVRILKWNEVAR